jgi:hypothetical protein
MGDREATGFPRDLIVGYASRDFSLLAASELLLAVTSPIIGTYREPLADSPGFRPPPSPTTECA